MPGRYICRAHKQSISASDLFDSERSQVADQRMASGWVGAALMRGERPYFSSSIILKGVWQQLDAAYVEVGKDRE